MTTPLSKVIAYLQTLDPRTEVSVVVHSNGTGYYDQGGNARTEPFSLANLEHDDFRGKKTLLLGRYKD